MTNELAPDAASHEPTVRLRSCGRTLLIPTDLTSTDQALAAWVMWPVLLEEGKTHGELAQKACRRVRIETAGSTRAIAAACLFFAETAGMRHIQFWRSISDHLIAITVLFRAPVQSNRAKKSPQGCGAAVQALRNARSSSADKKRSRGLSSYRDRPRAGFRTTRSCLTANVKKAPSRAAIRLAFTG